MDLGNDNVRAYNNINAVAADFTKAWQVEWVNTEIELVSDA
jgi:hypothetical protein